MADVTRIIVRKQDEAATVVEQLIDADTDAIVFSIPKGSVFSQSLNNFKLLKREGSVLGKEIIIESEDPLVQERAVKAGLEIGETPEEDAEEAEEPEEKEEVHTATRVAAGKLPRGRSLKVKESPDEDEDEPVRKISRLALKKKSAPIEDAVSVDSNSDTEAAEEEGVEESAGEPVRPSQHKKSFFSRGRLIFAAGVIVFIGGLAYVAAFVLPKATIELEMKKDQWSFSSPIVVDKSISVIDLVGGKIPGQVFTQKNTTNSKLPATGAEFIERKATGVLTVYNSYSSQAQSIVATTRFVTPKGIVFRTTQALTIPGAKIDNGNIIPSSITVPVVADIVGPSGNVGATARLTIPGFAKTPKFNGFYGELKEGATGGFSGKSKVATESDIKAAKADGAKVAEQLVRAQIAGQVPDGFKVIEGSSQFSVVRQVVNQIADTEGNFSVVTDAQLSVFAFQEKDIRDFLAAKMALATSGNGDFKVDSETLEYGNLNSSSIIARGGRAALPVSYSASLSHKIDIDALRTMVLGKDESQLNSVILGTPGVIGGKVNLWPFYVGAVPADPGKVSIIVQ